MSECVFNLFDKYHTPDTGFVCCRNSKLNYCLQSDQLKLNVSLRVHSSPSRWSSPIVTAMLRKSVKFECSFLSSTHVDRHNTMDANNWYENQIDEVWWCSHNFCPVTCDAIMSIKSQSSKCAMVHGESETERYYRLHSPKYNFVSHLK